MNLKCDIMVSKFAFKFDLYRYNKMGGATLLKKGGFSTFTLLKDPESSDAESPGSKLQRARVEARSHVKKGKHRDARSLPDEDWLSSILDAEVELYEKLTHSLKAPGFNLQPLNLKCDILVPKFALQM